MRKAVILVIAASFAAAAAAVLTLFFGRSVEPCPMPDYMSYQGPAEDVLILRGKCVVPSAIEALRDRSLPKRPFVIRFLGNGEFSEALGPMISIADDETDPNRGPALIAVFRINNIKGQELARKYEGQQDDLGKISRDILVNKDYLHERTTYAQALRSYISVTFAF